jgi:quinol monooxygenase YgiN
MLIIAGKLYMAPQERDKWVEAHDDVIKRARTAPGCLDLYVSADPVEAGRVNIFELWESEAHLEACERSLILRRNQRSGVEMCRSI